MVSTIRPKQIGSRVYKRDSSGKIIKEKKKEPVKFRKRTRIKEVLPSGGVVLKDVYVDPEGYEVGEAYLYKRFSGQKPVRTTTDYTYQREIPTTYYSRKGKQFVAPQTINEDPRVQAIRTTRKKEILKQYSVVRKAEEAKGLDRVSQGLQYQQTKEARGQSPVLEQVGAGIAGSALGTIRFGKQLVTQPTDTIKQAGAGIFDLGKRVVTGQGVSEKFAKTAKTRPAYTFGFLGFEALSVKGTTQAFKGAGNLARGTINFFDPKGVFTRTRTYTLPSGKQAIVKEFRTKQGGLINYEVVPRGSGFITEAERKSLEKIYNQKISKQSTRGAFGYSQIEQQELLGKQGVSVSAQTIERFREGSFFNKVERKLLGNQLPKAIAEGKKPLAPDKPFYVSPFDIGTGKGQARASRIFGQEGSISDLLDNKINIKESFQQTMRQTFGKKEFFVFRESKYPKEFRLTPTGEIEGVKVVPTLQPDKKLGSVFLQGRRIKIREFKPDFSSKKPVMDTTPKLGRSSQTPKTLPSDLFLGYPAKTTEKLAGSASNNLITMNVPQFSSTSSKTISLNFGTPTKNIFTTEDVTYKTPKTNKNIKVIYNIQSPSIGGSGGSGSGGGGSGGSSGGGSSIGSIITGGSGTGSSIGRGWTRINPPVYAPPTTLPPFFESPRKKGKKKKKRSPFGYDRSFKYTAGFPELTLGISGRRKRKTKAFSGFEARPLKIKLPKFL